MYKELLVADGFTRHELTIAHGAFYSGARGVLAVLAHHAEAGEINQLQRVIARHGRTLEALQGWHLGSDGTRARPGVHHKLPVSLDDVMWPRP